MKNFLAAAAVVLSASTQLYAQTIPANTISDIVWGDTQTVSFVVDKLPVDGPFKAVTFTKDLHTYNGVFRKVIANRFTGEFNTTEKDVGSDLSCETNVDATAAVCSLDMRLVNGPLYVIDMTLNDNNLYDVTSTTKYFDMRSGQEVEKTEVLLKDASLSLPIPLHAN